MSSISSQISNWVFICFIVGIPLFGAYKKIDVFDSFVTGAKQGFDTSITIIPYLIAMLVAIGMLRASGFFDVVSHILAPILNRLGVPSEILPLALIRPFSGSAATGVMAELIHNHGGNAYISNVAATMMGSTETTFYVIAVYFGAVNIKISRHAIPAGLFADIVGIIAAIAVCNYMFL
jgi:spore maturation protein B